MNKEELTRALEYTEKKHRHDTVNTFDTDISMMCVDVLKVLKNCIEIPENATNGDVIKALFPNAKTEESYTYVVYAHIEECDHPFDKAWWNAPYRRETE